MTWSPVANALGNVAWEPDPEMPGVKVETDEAKANGRLIAAAPDLLAALMELVNLKTLKDTDGKTDGYEARQPKAWEVACAALAKAQGGEHG